MMCQHNPKSPRHKKELGRKGNMRENIRRRAVEAKRRVSRRGTIN